MPEPKRPNEPGRTWSREPQRPEPPLRERERIPPKREPLRWFDNYERVWEMRRSERGYAR